MTKQLEFTAGIVKAAMTAADASKRDIWYVPRKNLIIEPGFNVRDEDEEYQAHRLTIGEAIHADGYDAAKPLTVFIRKGPNGEDEIVVIDGHTRVWGVDYANSKGSEIEMIPCIPTPKGTSMIDLNARLINANKPGRGLKPNEAAKVIKRMMGWNMTEAEVADKLKITLATVKNALTLAEAPAAVRAMVAEGTVSATQAIATVKAEGGAAAVETLGKAVESAKAAGKKKATKKTVANVGGKVQSKYKLADYEAMARELLSIKKDAGDAVFPEPERMQAVFVLAASMLK